MADATLETKIWEALRLRVVEVGSALGLPVSYPAENFSPDVKNGFLITSYVPNISQRIAIGNDEQHAYNGILQIDVMMPLRVHVMSQAMQKCGDVVAMFPESLKMRFEDITVQPTKRGDVAQGYRDNGMWRTPVSIRWQCVA